MSANKATQKSAKTTTAVDQTPDGWTDDERAAMKERAQEVKGAGRRGAGADRR